MKTIVCGPPHSGKSVFISNLVRLMPSESFQRITANGDGEGTWSNNPNQKDVQSVRKKGTNSEKDFMFWKSLIDNASQQIVLVDIGGRLQDDKIPLFEACDSFIIVSNNEEMIDRWLEFGNAHGCKCIATVFSELGGCKEEILSYEPYIQCKLSGLERGHDIHGSHVLAEVAGAIVDASGYNGFKSHSSDVEVDLFEIGRKLKCVNTWFTHKGKEVNTVWFEPTNARMLHEYLTDTYVNTCPYKIFGAKSLWVSCIATLSLGNKMANNISFFDEWTNAYISPHLLKKSNKYNNDVLEIHVKETRKRVLLSFDLKNYINLEFLHLYKIPEINESKPLFISGKMPNWFVASVIKSYNSTIIYIHIPGLGYICVANNDYSKLGEICTDVSSFMS